MRVVERTPWAEKRSARHDEICFAVASRPERLFPRFTGEVQATVEAPCGHGFVDVLARTVAPCAEREVALVEVKTNDERASAGDIIRQLKWYRKQLDYLREQPRMVLVVEDAWDVPSVTLELLLREWIDVLPVGYFQQEIVA